MYVCVCVCKRYARSTKSYRTESKHGILRARARMIGGEQRAFVVYQPCVIDVNRDRGDGGTNV